MEEEITTAERFYASLKKELKCGQVLHMTRPMGKDKVGREATFSGWEEDGCLRFHLPLNGHLQGIMRYIAKEDILAVYAVYEPGNITKLGQQIGKLCRYKDIRKVVLQQLFVLYG